jgi:hypothetical protein
MNNARSQERLIGGKKPAITFSQQQQTMPYNPPVMPLQSILMQPSQPVQPQVPLEDFAHGKVKRSGAMKTQATQTEGCLGKKPMAAQQLSLSPRTIQRVSKRQCCLIPHKKDKTCIFTLCLNFKAIEKLFCGQQTKPNRKHLFNWVPVSSLFFVWKPVKIPSGNEIPLKSEYIWRNFFFARVK